MRVSTCCCGCSLEQGCKIIAILGLVFGGLGLIYDCVNTDVGGIVSNILGLIAYGLLLWGTLYDNFIVKRYSQCIIVEV